ncbi:MAG TPA: hypothetical protein VL172_00720 [Kofleriaceae bacterium]|nr:hypothetical protein [Kofleriaceae bacterium]
MHVEQQALARVAEPDARDLGWFAARQPGIIRFLEQRLGGDADAHGVALLGAWRIHSAFAARDDLPPPRVERSLLDRAAIAVAMESRHGADDGCAARQPDLCGWLVGWLADPPVPLEASDSARVGAVLAAVIYALDQLTTGRPIP